MGTQKDRAEYPLLAGVWLGEAPDEPGEMIVITASVRLARGHWCADVFGLPLRCVQVFNVTASTDQPFGLDAPWLAAVAPDDGPDFEDTVTGWDGERWVVPDLSRG